MEGLVDIFDRRKDTCVMLFDKTSNSITNRLNELFCDFNYKYFAQYHQTEERVSFNFFYMFLSNGFYGLMRYWFNNYEKMSKSEVTALAYVLIKRLLIPGNPDINYDAFAK